MADRPWWEEIAKCRGLKKNGTKCNNYASKPYEVEPGNLFIPLTCYLHRNQENKLRAN